MYNPAKPKISSTTVSEARRGFADIVNRVAYGSERVIVARHGRDLVAIVPMSDMHRLEAMTADVTPGAGVGSAAAAPPRRRPGNAPRP